MSDTHSKPFSIGQQNPAEDCGLPEPIRPDGPEGLMVTADCIHGTRFLLVQQFEYTNVWMDAEKYWAESRGMYEEHRYTYEEHRYTYEEDWNF